MGKDPENKEEQASSSLPNNEASPAKPISESGPDKQVSEEARSETALEFGVSKEQPTYPGPASPHEPYDPGPPPGFDAGNFYDPGPPPGYEGYDPGPPAGYEYYDPGPPPGYEAYDPGPPPDYDGDSSSVPSPDPQDLAVLAAAGKPAHESRPSASEGGAENNLDKEPLSSSAKGSEAQLKTEDALPDSGGSGAGGNGPVVPAAEETDGKEMTFFEHLEELRRRFFWIILWVALGFLLCFAYAEEILTILLQPLKNVLPPKSSLIATELTEAFVTSMKAALVAGIFLTSPLTFYQLWKFIAPGLYKEEKRVLIPIAFFSALCFVAGGIFGYYVVFPFGFDFLATYADKIITLMPTLDAYFSFSMWLLVAFGIIFELPLFIFFLAKLGVVTHKGLRKHQRWAILGAFILAAILTPTPDVINQCLMAGPIILLYEVGIWVAYFFGKKKDVIGEPKEQVQEGQENA